MRECEEMLKIVQSSRDLQLDLVDSSRLASHQKLHMCQACGEGKRRASRGTTRQKVQSGLSVSWRLGLATQSSRKAKSPDHSVMKK